MALWRIPPTWSSMSSTMVFLKRLSRKLTKHPLMRMSSFSMSSPDASRASETTSFVYPCRAG